MNKKYLFGFLFLVGFLAVGISLVSAAFFPGDRVVTTANVNVRQNYMTSSSILGVQPSGSLGTVQTTSSPWNTYNVNFDAGVDGWVSGLYLAIPSSTPSSTPICGDNDGNGSVSIGDAVYVINYVNAGGPAPSPLWKGDVNHDGMVNISDAVYLINYIFSSGPAPSCPGPVVPVVNSISPTSGPNGTVITLTGSGFYNTAYPYVLDSLCFGVSFTSGCAAAYTTPTSDTQIQFTVPSATYLPVGTYYLTLSTATGAHHLTQQFTVTSGQSASSSLLIYASPLGATSGRAKAIIDDLSAITFNATGSSPMFLDFVRVLFRGSAVSSSFPYGVKLYNPSTGVSYQSSPVPCSNLTTTSSKCFAEFYLNGLQIPPGSAVLNLRVNSLDYTNAASNGVSQTLVATIDSPGDVYFHTQSNTYWRNPTQPPYFPINLNSVSYAAGTIPPYVAPVTPTPTYYYTPATPTYTAPTPTYTPAPVTTPSKTTTKQSVSASAYDSVESIRAELNNVALQLVGLLSLIGR